MGINNQQRRAAKRRKKMQSGGRSPSGDGQPRRGSGQAGPDGSGAAGSEAGDLRPTDLLEQLLATVGVDPSRAGALAESLYADGAGQSREQVVAAARRLLAHLVRAVVRAGWSPSDLGQVVTRQLGPARVPVVATALHALAVVPGAGEVSAAWSADLASLGPARPAGLDTAGALLDVLRVCELLRALPVIVAVLPPPGVHAPAARVTAQSESRVLARVRALLGKAESTEFPEEAEALSAKAQELITRHSLDGLLASAQADVAQGVVGARRLWLDLPYVLGKATLVEAVARANRCRSVLTEQLGFSTVVGAPRDLDAVELLTTSLLVQATAAMVRHGRQADRAGRSRTTSSRRSFLTSYAHRISERLDKADAEATRATGRAGELVPVLRRHAEHVDSAVHELFPETTARETVVSNGLGWAAGRAAADLARLETARQVRQAG